MSTANPTGPDVNNFQTYGQTYGDISYSTIDILLSCTDLDTFNLHASQIKLSDLTIQQQIQINKLYNTLERQTKKIRYTFTDDEYGKAARALHMKTHGLKFAYHGDAGIDIPIVLSKEDQARGHKKIWPNERDILHTGIVIEFPEGYHGRVIHRSSSERHYRLRIIEGIIDDYRGELLVQVCNQNNCQAEVEHGNKLAQLIILPNCGFQIEQINGELRPSNRGSKGFGSSGK